MLVTKSTARPQFPKMKQARNENKKLNKISGIPQPLPRNMIRRVHKQVPCISGNNQLLSHSHWDSSVDIE
jgi:hypothetical protein